MARLFDNGSSQRLARDSVPVGIEPMSISAWFYADDVTIPHSIAAVSKFTSTTADELFDLRMRGDIAGDPITAQRGGLTGAISTTGVTVNT